jgi:stalled ribosome rescue protein Dom34
MKTTVGLWIDHRKAVIMAISDKKEEKTVIESKVEKQPGRFAGKRSLAPYEAQMVAADDTRERKFTGQLNNYFDEVISVIRDAESILIFGPGEAKGELKKRLEQDKLAEHIVVVETADEMTDPQITAKIREYFQQ